MQFPDDPNNFNISPLAQGVGLAFMLAILRSLYDAKEEKWTRIMLEGGICAALTFACHSALVWVGLPDGLIVFVGGFIGYIGATKFREFILRFVVKKLDN